jgi:hypothetical protein
MSATYPAHLIVLYFITRIIFGEPFKLWSSTLCSLLQPPATSSLFGPNILLSTPHLFHPLVWDIKFHTHTKKQVNLSFMYFNL